MLLIPILFALLATRAASGAPATSLIVINEIDYDQPVTDNAEFIEIYNGSGASIDLDPYSLRLVNGVGNGASIYRTIELPAVSLEAGDYYVVCADISNVANCDLDISPDTDLIQNGDPDAVALISNGTLVDTISYGGNTGAPYTETSCVGLEDDPGNPDTSGRPCITLSSLVAAESSGILGPRVRVSTRTRTTEPKTIQPMADAARDA